MNLVAAGPDQDHGGQVDPRASATCENGWTGRAPLGWDATDPTPVAKAVCALLRDWFPATSGSMVWATAASTRSGSDAPASHGSGLPAWSEP